MFHPLKVFSYGGGVQSTAALVLAAWVSPWASQPIETEMGERGGLM